jgi:hypothetical protein
MSTSHGKLESTSSWVKLNTDGASKDSCLASCGGLIRGVDEELLGGFSKGIGNGIAYVAELWCVLLDCNWFMIKI